MLTIHSTESPEPDADHGGGTQGRPKAGSEATNPCGPSDGGCEGLTLYETFPGTRTRVEVVVYGDVVGDGGTIEVGTNLRLLSC